MVFVKDLSKLGRPLNKTIIVDNVAENFSLQPDNGIFIKSWFEDPSDTALLELAPLLKCKKKNKSPNGYNRDRRKESQRRERSPSQIPRPDVGADPERRDEPPA
jgi:TFIIF-interacting CTD phosphatase-like protein